MYDEGYVKIPLARYEELRQMENDLENQKRSVLVSDFVEETIIGEEKVNEMFSFSMRKTVNLKVNVEKMFEAVRESYNKTSFREERKEINMISIEDQKERRLSND